MTGYVKMVDVWMIFTMFCPFLVIALHSSLEVNSRRGNSARFVEYLMNIFIGFKTKERKLF